MTPQPRSRQPSLLRRIAPHNHEGTPGARAARVAKADLDRATLVHRKAHVLWCSCCRRMPLLDGKKEANTQPLQLSLKAPDTEVVFCEKCPRKLCRACYALEVSSNEDRTAWVSLGRSRGSASKANGRPVRLFARCLQRPSQPSRIAIERRHCCDTKEDVAT